MQEKIAALHTAASEGNLKLLQTLANKKLMAAKVGQIISSFLCLCFTSSLKDGDFRRFLCFGLEEQSWKVKKLKKG
jgi:hypothetical protein